MLLLGYNRYSGLHPDTTCTEFAIDSVEEMGIGLLLSAVVLFLIGRLTAEQDTGEMPRVIPVTRRPWCEA